MADPAPPAGYSVDDQTSSASTSAPTIAVAPNSGADIVSHVHALINSGASGQQVRAYISSQGLDPADIHGLDDAITYRAQNPEKDITVVPNTNTSAQSSDPDLPPGFTVDGGDPAPAPPKSVGDQLIDATKNTAAGIAQGVTAIPDAATEFAAGTGRIIAKGVQGAGWLANQVSPGLGDGLQSAGQFADQNLAHPVTLGGVVESVAPTPQDSTGKAVRFASQLAGGAVSIPGVTTLPNSFLPDIPSTYLTAGQKVAQAAQQEGVKVLPADVGGPFTRRMTAAFAQSPLGAGPIAEGARAAVGSFANRANKLAAEAGNVTDAQGAGEAAQSGARSFIQASATKASKLFDAALKRVHPNTPVVVDKTIEATRKTLNTLSSTPEIANIMQSPALRKFGDALSSDAAGANGSIPLDAARKLRTAVGQAMDNHSLTDDLKAADLKRVYAALSQDIERAVDVASRTGAAPKGTLARLKAANKYYQARMDRIENVLSSVLGKDGKTNPQAAFESIQRMAGNKGGDPRKLAALMQSLPADEAKAVRATIISKLGEAKPGSQNAAGTAFSSAEFLTNWNRLSPRAKDLLFGGSLRQSLDNLATIAEGSKAAAKYAGHSNTGAVEIAEKSARKVGELINYAAAGAGGTSAAFGHPGAAVAAVTYLAGQYVGGKFFASPVAVRQLVRIASAKTPQQATNFIRGLTTVATADRTLAPSIPALQQKLMGVVSDSAPRVGQAVASPDQGPQQQ